MSMTAKTLYKTMQRKKATLIVSLFGGILLSAGALGGVAYAAVVIGSGGTASNAADAGDGYAYTWKGWGWYRFNVDGSNGQPLRWQDRSETWATASTKCRNAGATELLAFLVQTVDNSTNPANAAIYSYQSSWSSFSNHKSPGAGGYAWISTATAQAAFNALPPGGGWTFGSNVGWFCSAFQNDWTLTGSTTRNKSTVVPGDTVRFNSTIRNSNEGGTAVFQYGPRYFYSSTSNPTRSSGYSRYVAGVGGVLTNESSGGIANRSGNLAPSGSLSVPAQTITVQNNAAYRYICGVAGFSPQNESGGMNGRSRPVCVEIRRPWTIRGTTSVQGNLTKATVGQTIVFNSTIRNNPTSVGDATFQYGPRYFYSNTSSPTPDTDGQYRAGAGGVVTNENRVRTNGVAVGNSTATNLAPGASVTVPWLDVQISTTARYVCGVAGYSPYNDLGDRYGRSAPMCVEIALPPISCNFTSGNLFEVGVPFQLTARVDAGTESLRDAYRDLGSPSYLVEYQTVGSPTWTTIPVASTNNSGSNAYIDVTANPLTIATGDQYKVKLTTASTTNFTFIDGTKSIDCEQLIRVAYKPYFHVNGGDIYSGGDITSWNEDAGGYTGAGGQLAALASGDITSFVTGRLLSPGGVGTGTSLAFANTASEVTPPSDYGGGYQVTTKTRPSMDNLSPDMRSLPSSTVSIGSGIPVYVVDPTDPDSPERSDYRYTGDVRISGTMDNRGGDPWDITLYIDGDVYITDNIRYLYTEIKEIPRLTVVATGNIYVQSNVTEIHGIFYAGDGDVATTDNGVFYTCAAASGNIDLNDAGIYAQCKTEELRIYGAVVADKLVLQRTRGTLNTPGEPAETFYYSPETWLAPASPNGSEAAIPEWDSFNNLPPIL